MEEIKSNPLGSERISKLMVKFAVPSIIGMIVSALYNIVDQLFIGNFVGALGNAATNIAFPFSTACIALSLMFGIGGASCFNLNMGRGETKKAPYFVGNSIFALTVSGIVLMVVTLLFLKPLLLLFGSSKTVLHYAIEYVSITAIGFPFLILTTGGGHLIRADASPKMAMFCNLLGAVVNIILDAIFVPLWGMSGAAWATIIGQILSAIVVIIYLFNFKTVKLKFSHFLPKFKYLAKTASIGMASFINQLAIMLVIIILNNSLRYYGGLSIYGEDIPIACSGIIMKVNQIVFSIVIGLSQGTQPIESFNYGAKNYTRVKNAYKLAIVTGAVISIVAFAFFQIFPKEILGLFGKKNSNLYFEFGVKFFRMFLFFTWLNFIQPITSTFFTSIGKPVKGIILSLTRQIIFFLPPLLILPTFFGINGIFYTGPIADFMAAVVNIAFIAYEFNLMTKEQKALQK